MMMWLQSPAGQAHTLRGGKIDEDTAELGRAASTEEAVANGVEGDIGQRQITLTQPLGAQADDAACDFRSCDYRFLTAGVLCGNGR